MELSEYIIRGGISIGILVVFCAILAKIVYRSPKCQNCHQRFPKKEKNSGYVRCSTPGCPWVLLESNDQQDHAPKR
jgi:hypothetical protein